MSCLKTEYEPAMKKFISNENLIYILTKLLGCMNINIVAACFECLWIMVQFTDSTNLVDEVNLVYA